MRRDVQHARAAGKSFKEQTNQKRSQKKVQYRYQYAIFLLVPSDPQQLLNGYGSKDNLVDKKPVGEQTRNQAELLLFGNT